MKEDRFFTLIKTPQEIFPSYEGQIEDVDLSDNLMVILTSTGKVYYSGLWKYFIPTELTLPTGVRPVSIGAAHDSFGFVDDLGNIWGWNGFVESKKKFFDYNLSLADTKDLGGKLATAIGGKYGGKFALASASSK